MFTALATLLCAFDGHSNRWLLFLARILGKPVPHDRSHPYRDQTLGPWKAKGLWCCEQVHLLSIWCNLVLCRDMLMAAQAHRPCTNLMPPHQKTPLTGPPLYPSPTAVCIAPRARPEQHRMHTRTRLWRSKGPVQSKVLATAAGLQRLVCHHGSPQTPNYQPLR